MMFVNARQLKDWIKSKSKQTGTSPNILLRSYMMERLLERVSISSYRKNMILKGGFLIAAMVGIDRRSTMDMDTTIKGLSINREKIYNIMKEIININTGDGVTFEIQDIKNIHEISEYDDFRISIKTTFYTVRTDMKIDITTGDTVFPCEIEYHYKLMFEERTIPVMAYSIYTILAEKIETILSRNVTNTRGRDFYDIYILLSMNKDILSKSELFHTLYTKAEERKSVGFIKDYAKHLQDIANSPEIAKTWTDYIRSYPYAKGIAMLDIISLINWVFKN